MSDKETVSETEMAIDVIAEKYDKEERTGLDSLKIDINLKPKGNYQTIRNVIRSDKVYFRGVYRNDAGKAIDSASKYLYGKLIDELVPHWYGRPWDFNGHTNMPNEGEVACGYFVSTTLKHIDFNVNRYKMAQQAGLNIAKALQSESELKTYGNIDFDTLKHRLNLTYSNGLYFVGLDNHVGYVLIKDEELYFLHSSYCDDKVVIELAETSLCFRSNIYVFAEITTNEKLVEKWILNEEVIVTF